MSDQYYAKVKPVMNIDTWKLCVKPYPGHKKGCPNFNKKDGCPPRVNLMTTVLDFSKDIYVIYNVFPIYAHANRMLNKHPRWSHRQLYCCLYWQGTARKQLREKIRLFLTEHRGLKVIGCPEAHGVNLTATMKSIDINLEWPPKMYAYQIAMAGTPRVQGRCELQLFQASPAQRTEGVEG